MIEPQATRTPIHFASKEEFEGRPNYVKALRCESDSLDYIVGKYGFGKDKIVQCGLNGCNQWHRLGFVIATKSGEETNCGKDCGRREFKVSWDDIHAAFERREIEKARRDLADAFLRDRSAILQDALVMQTNLSSACVSIKTIMAEMRKDSALEQAFSRVAANDGRIQIAATVDKDVGFAFGQRGENANIDTIGTIRGIHAAEQYDRVGGLFDWQVVRPLKEMSSADISLLTDEELERSSKTLQTLREGVLGARAFLEASGHFLAQSNLAEIKKLKETIPRRYRTGRLDRVIGRLDALFAK
ncbi:MULTISPECIES: hypothetical protein [Paraburkholderia]|uniref:hypothetical protein n=1 Tax=Paraburkholderia TaxID=1822464 RepID=UPI002252A1D1|nr:MULTISPECIES: hypothetical protein [Paraburkholderia]MCX4159636.1 hypothetical protein [Paraburkholderia aspalathi]MDN7169034.1 hypothetical protein [Paraburkholderia sp. SECH2]MDQ6397521.1 hypothetical protein [Paraburkholderia aspalathi]